MERYESIKPASRIFFFSSKAVVGPYSVRQQVIKTKGIVEKNYKLHLH